MGFRLKVDSDHSAIHPCGNRSRDRNAARPSPWLEANLEHYLSTDVFDSDEFASRLQIIPLAIERLHVNVARGAPAPRFFSDTHLYGGDRWKPVADQRQTWFTPVVSRSHLFGRG